MGSDGRDIGLIDVRRLRRVRIGNVRLFSSSVSNLARSP